MYVALSTIQSIAALVYMVVGLVSLLISYDFFLSKDGVLRKILIFVFFAWAMHYLVLALLFAFHVKQALVMMSAIGLTTLDFSALISLYYYMRWKN